MSASLIVNWDSIFCNKILLRKCAFLFSAVDESRDSSYISAPTARSTGNLGMIAGNRSIHRYRQIFLIFVDLVSIDIGVSNARLRLDFLLLNYIYRMWYIYIRSRVDLGIPSPPSTTPTVTNTENSIFFKED